MLTRDLQGLKHTKDHLDEMSVVACRWPTGPSASALLSSTEDTHTRETSSSASSPRTGPRYVKHRFSAATNRDRLVSCSAFLIGFDVLLIFGHALLGRFEHTRDYNHNRYLT